MDAPSKRLKLDESSENALNLSLTADHRPRSETDNNNCLQDMRQRFQQWVIETYKDSSKTKTITAKKYERIVRTLAGEIKNCAENSKFRFWMKCKGFKLETQLPGGTKSLLVQDKKGNEMKYKKVAVVENFFDIIYNVHINEGARGIQHAGQKRTHRTITETYAFLPREAVTKFLLCCADCQKRTHEERKISPNSSSCDSLHEQNDQSTTQLELDHSTCTLMPSNCTTNEYDYEELKLDLEPQPTSAHSDCDNNNCLNKDIDQLAEPFNYSTKVLMSKLNTNDLTRKRKRKFTRKIVRPMTESHEVEFDRYVYERPINFPTEVKYEEEVQIPMTETMEQVSRIQELKQNLHDQNSISAVPTHVRNITPFLNFESHFNEENFRGESKYKRSSHTMDIKRCPYITKICELFHNPSRYAQDNERNNCASSEEEFLERLAIDLILKARHLESVKGILTEDERQQLSSKVYSCRISSFLLNYAADLMLRSVITE